MPTYLKLVKFVAIVPYFGQQVEATFSSLLSFQILSFFLFLLYFALSVGAGAYYVLGPQLASYNTMLQSFWTTFRAIVAGGLELDALENLGTMGWCTLLVTMLIGSKVCLFILLRIVGEV